MGDILAVLGLGERGAARAMIGAWDRILAAVRPAAVMSDFAPGLMLASFGRLPLLSVGTGFALPPAHLDRFPSLTRQPTVHDEAGLVEIINEALAAHGRPRRASLPGIFSADRRSSPNSIPIGRGDSPVPARHRRLFRRSLRAAAMSCSSI